MEPKLNPPTKPIAPPGLQKLIEQCQNLYPDQKNPLQVTTLLKYWYVLQDRIEVEISKFHLNNYHPYDNN